MVVCYSEELCCAALTLVSQLVVEMVNSSCQVKTDENCKLTAERLRQRSVLFRVQFSATLLSLLVNVCMCCSDCFQGVAAVACLGRWGKLLCSCCSEEQPTEVKLAAAKVLVSCTRSVLSSPQLPLGKCCE